MFMYYLCMSAVAVGTVLYVVLKHLVLRIPKKMTLNGKHVLITGGSKGIGKALAIKCAKQGANVTIIARDVKSLELAHKELVKICDFEAMERGRTQWAKWISLDLTQDYEKIETAIRGHMDQHGAVDVLINNAGTSTQAPFCCLPIDQFSTQMSTNYLSAVYVTRAVLPYMKDKAELNEEGESKASCRIVFMSSQAGQIGLYGYCAYAPSKFALRGLAESLQMEMAPYDVHTTVVYPPNTDTEGLKVALAFPGGDENKLRSVQHCELVYRSLDDIVNDKYNKQFHVNRERGYLGLTYDEVKQVTSAVGRQKIGWKSANKVGLVEKFRRLLWKKEQNMNQRSSPFLASKTVIQPDKR